MKLGFRQTLEWYTRDKDFHEFYENLNECFTGMALFIREHHPNAELVYKGSDPGGHIWAVEERK